MNHLQMLNDTVAAAADYPGGKDGRGVVMGVGGHKFFVNAWIAISVLRRCGCELPVEVWHLGPAELDPAMIGLLRTLPGVIIVDAYEVRRRHPARILNGWELKPYSTIHSRFREAMYVDADNIVTRDPSYLFDGGEYQEHGAAYWPDLPPHRRKEWVPAAVWQACGMEYRREHDFESGQLIVDKSRCWHELAVTMHLNEYSDHYYQLVFGDKSCWHLAWRKCGRDYAMPTTPPGWRWPAIQQYDFAGQVVFQHCCQGKEALMSGRHLSTLDKALWCQQARQELYRQWSGLIWNWADMTGEERDLAEAIAGDYLYRRINQDERPMRLDAGGGIGVGTAACEKRWSLRLLDGVPTIVIVGEAHKKTEIGMMFLTQAENGVWTGEWQAHEHCRIELCRK